MDWGDRIGRRIKLRDLHILLAVVNSGSMTKAARHLSVSNPVVSKAVADLERALGVRILERSAHGIETTVYGRALLDHGLAAFDELRQAVKRIESISDPAAGELTVGTTNAIATSFVPAVIARLSRRYPRIAVNLIAGEASMGSRALGERNVDMAILRIHKPVEPRMQSEVLYEDIYVVAAGAQTGWARRRRAELADLIEEPWALPSPDSLVGSAFEKVFLASGLDYPRAAVSTYSMPARAALVASGHFLSILPFSVTRFPATQSAIKALPVNLPSMRRPVALIRFKDRSLSPAAQLFADCARHVAKSMSGR
jgi:DNA-binding transcriptional LysR family regulator